MMRSISILAVLLLLALPIKAQETGLLEEYLSRLDHYDLNTKIEESDFIIGSCVEAFPQLPADGR